MEHFYLMRMYIQYFKKEPQFLFDQPRTWPHFYVMLRKVREIKIDFIEIVDFILK